MKLIYDLPQQLKDQIKNKVKEKILYCVPYDLTLENTYTDGYFVITKTYYIMIEHEKIKTIVRIVNGKDYKTINLSSSGYLEGNINGTYQIIARFSMTQFIRFMYIASILETLANNHVPKVISDDYDNKCPNCGRVLRRGSKVCPNCMNKRHVLKRLYKIVKPYNKAILITLLIFWMITGLSLVNPYIYRILIDNYLIKHNEDIPMILLLVGSIGLCSLFSTIFQVIKNRLMVRVGSSLSKDLRNEVYTKIQSLSLSYLDQRKTGDLMNRVTRDTNRIQNFITNQASMGINQFLTLFVVMAILFIMNWKLALLVLVPVPLIIIYLRKMSSTFMRMYHSQWKTSDKANSTLHDILSGIRVVKAFGMEKKEVSRFSNISEKLARVTASNEKKYNTIFPFLNFVMGIGQFFILYYGGGLILDHQMDLGELTQFTIYTNMIYGPLGWLTFFPRALTDALTSTERIFEIIDEEVDIENNSDQVQMEIKGDVTLKDVTFGYKTYEPVLKNINLEVKKGEMIGLVGHSGAGKSTLINLLMRLYDVDDGHIMIDNQDLKDISLTDLRKQMGVVLQETFLFAGSIRQNITYAKPNATLDEVISASKIANAHDFIMKFPDGYDTIVGEKGHRLSGGEKQRIAIARAILHDPKILILDEATASVDTETEYLIQEALGKLIKDRTTFAIAHRLSTLRNATRLIVLEKGKMIECGTHDELMRAEGKYHSLVMAQREFNRTSKEEIEVNN